MKLYCMNYGPGYCGVPDANETSNFQCAGPCEYDLINLTPHEINLVTEKGTVSIPPSGAVARCAVSRELVSNYGIGETYVPINRTIIGEVTDLPEPSPNIYYIVSSIVAQAARRDDLLVVDDTVRDGQGRIVGAKALAKI